jgi:hypothetical protein
VSAEGFVVYYGLRWDIRQDDEATVQALERREDQRIQSARRNGLETYWGRTEEEERYFLFVGRELGCFGREGQNSAQVEDETLLRILDETKRKLKAAGFLGLPALHCQFEPDY